MIAILKVESEALYQSGYKLAEGPIQPAVRRYLKGEPPTFESFKIEFNRRARKRLERGVREIGLPLHQEAMLTKVGRLPRS